MRGPRFSLWPFENQESISEAFRIMSADQSHGETFRLPIIEKGKSLSEAALSQSVSSHTRMHEIREGAQGIFKVPNACSASGITVYMFELPESASNLSQNQLEEFYRQIDSGKSMELNASRQLAQIGSGITNQSTAYKHLFVFDTPARFEVSSLLSSRERIMLDCEYSKP